MKRHNQHSDYRDTRFAVQDKLCGAGSGLNTHVSLTGMSVGISGAGE